MWIHCSLFPKYQFVEIVYNKVLNAKVVTHRFEITTFLDVGVFYAIISIGVIQTFSEGNWRLAETSFVVVLKIYCKMAQAVWNLDLQN